MAVRIENHAEPIPGYRLLERLGGGGFGEVWKCEAPGGLHKAIKFVFGDLGAAGDDGHRAEQELKALSRVKTVRHPYILSLERYDIIDGQLIIVMELADRNLWDRFKECRAQGLPGIPREELLGYMREVAEALDLMNEQYQLQHLDIKPQNLFLVHQHIKVADFGLVKDLEGMQASVTGGVTPVYASPETFDGYVSRYSDQYSLAIVYQELLTGQRPFVGTTVRQLILQHLQAQPSVAALPPGDRQAVLRALSKNPDERHPCCQDLIRALHDERPAGPPGAALSVGDAPAGAGEELPPGPTQPVAPARFARAEPGSSGSGADSHPGTTCPIRAIEVTPPRPAEDPRVPRKALPETHGDGVLFPALVIGLGGAGLQVLQRLRETVTAELGSPGRLPQLRLLQVDTDPEVIRQATQAERPGGALSAGEVLLTPLNRPSYYLKSRDSRPALETWFNPRMLYRIPRSQVTTGVRALGRLAFCDNYRLLRRRLQAELEALLEPEALAAAARDTGLGLRTNRPRVCIVSSLGGGTGGGMFLDLAYTVRALLRHLGCEQPDVTGLLLLPPVDGNRTRALTLGNACAALTELAHFARPGTVFTARYHEREEPLEDPAPPLGRCVLLSLPEETDEAAAREALALAGQYLFRDLCSPLGRTADLARAGVSCPPWESRGLYYQTFGLFRLSWPRAELFGAVARRLCQQLVTRWMSKDSKPVRQAAQEWVQDQWTASELGADAFIDRLGQLCVKKLGRPPESASRAVLQPLIERYGPPKGSASGTPGALPPRAPSRGGTPVEVPVDELAEALAGLEEVLGRPGDENAADPTGSLVQVIRSAADELVAAWGEKLAELPVRLIEKPEFRLAGAEEAVRQLVATIEQALHSHEPLTREVAGRAREAYDRLRSLIAPPRPSGPRAPGAPPARRPMPPAADVLELLRSYTKWRYQSLVMHRLGAAFVTLRGHLADEMREINFCRVRLTELLRMLEGPPAAADRPREGARGLCHLFPGGCKDLSEAAAEFLGRVTPEALRELDGRMSALFKARFVALVNVCLGSANFLKDVEAAMLETAGAFVAECVGETDVAAMFFAQHPDEVKAAGAVAGFFDIAAPAPLGKQTAPDAEPTRAPEVCVLAAPPGEAGGRFRVLARAALPGLEMHDAAGGPNAASDIVLYREVAGLPLAELEQLGPVGRDAYGQMTNTDNFTPHTRLDVNFGGVASSQ
jgi:hypothetical protein